MTEIVHKDNKFRMLLNRILSLTLMFVLITTFTFAGETETGAETSGGADYSVSGVVDDIHNSDEEVYKTIREIMSIMSGLGFVIAVLKLAQIGAMLMLSGATKKKDAKSALMPWAVGAAVCLLFGSVGPWVMELLMVGNSGGVFDI